MTKVNGGLSLASFTGRTHEPRQGKAFLPLIYLRPEVRVLLRTFTDIGRHELVDFAGIDRL
jgi:hypothetical protein